MGAASRGEYNIKRLHPSKTLPLISNTALRLRNTVPLRGSHFHSTIPGLRNNNTIVSCARGHNGYEVLKRLFTVGGRHIILAHIGSKCDCEWVNEHVTSKVYNSIVISLDIFRGIDTFMRRL